MKKTPKEKIKERNERNRGHYISPAERNLSMILAAIFATLLFFFGMFFGILIK